MDTRLKRSITFHSQIDGQIEVVNRIVVQLLRGYSGKHLKSRDEHLEYIQHAYNRAIHSSINKSPFETCFGYLPPSPFDCVFGQQKDEENSLEKEEQQATKFVDRIRQVHLKVQEQLETSQAKYKMKHKYRVDHKFHVGEYVWFHISRERLQGLAKKLKPIRYRPFEIMEKVSENAFRLNLLEYINIYSVVNVEHLKLYEPSMLTEDKAGLDHILPSIDDLAPNTMDEIKEDTILQKKVHAIRRDEIDLWLIGLKG